MWTCPGCGKEIPECVGCLGEIGEVLGGEEGDAWVGGMFGCHFVAVVDRGAPGGFGAGEPFGDGEGFMVGGGIGIVEGVAGDGDNNGGLVEENEEEEGKGNPKPEAAN